MSVEYVIVLKIVVQSLSNMCLFVVCALWSSPNPIPIKYKGFDEKRNQINTRIPERPSQLCYLLYLNIYVYSKHIVQSHRDTCLFWCPFGLHYKASHIPLSSIGDHIRSIFLKNHALNACLRRILTKNLSMWLREVLNPLKYLEIACTFLLLRTSECMVWEQYRRTSRLATAMMWSRRSIGIVKKVAGGNCSGNSSFLSSSAGDFWVGRNDEEIGDRNVDIFDRALKCKQVALQIL